MKLDDYSKEELKSFRALYFSPENHSLALDMAKKSRFLTDYIWQINSKLRGFGWNLNDFLYLETIEIKNTTRYRNIRAMYDNYFDFSYLKTIKFLSIKIPVEKYMVVHPCLLSMVFYNCLPSLPDFFQELTTLVSLSLGENEFKTIPEPILNLTNLRELSLERNQMETLSENITRFKNLEFLSLSNNNLKKIPDYISELTNLKTIDLSNNHDLTKVEALRNLPNIKTIYLNQTKVATRVLKKIKDVHEKCAIFTNYQLF